MSPRVARHGVRQTVMLTLTFLCGCRAGSAVRGPPRFEEPLAIFPLTSVGGMVFLAVGGDSGPARLWLLDSGFETSAVNRRYADSLRLRHYGHREQVAPGRHTDVGVIPGVQLHLGRVIFRPESLAVVDLHNVEPLFGVPYAGILGHDFLTQYVTRIDYDRRVVELFAPTSFVYSGSGHILPVWIEANEPFALGLLYVKGRTVPAKLKLDTGSLDVLGLNGSFIQQTDLAGGISRVSASGAAVGGKVAAYLIRLDSLAIGGNTVTRPIVGYSAETERRGDAGTVGMAFLGRFNLVFDYARRRVILESTARTDLPMAYDASGLLLTTCGPNLQGIKVLSVAQGSAGEIAGIQAGDSLIAIDGRSPSRLGLSGVRERFSQAGASLQLVVMRGGRERRMLLRLRPRL